MPYVEHTITLRVSASEDDVWELTNLNYGPGLPDVYPNYIAVTKDFRMPPYEWYEGADGTGDASLYYASLSNASWMHMRDGQDAPIFMRHDIGLRFRNCPVPQGATIISARIGMTVYSSSGHWPFDDIFGIAEDNCAGFTLTPPNTPTTKPRTLNFVTQQMLWGPHPPGDLDCSLGVDQNSEILFDCPEHGRQHTEVWPHAGKVLPDPTLCSGHEDECPTTLYDLKDIVQEIINRPGYQAGNALGVLVMDNAEASVTPWFDIPYVTYDLIEHGVYGSYPYSPYPGDVPYQYVPRNGRNWDWTDVPFITITYLAWEDPTTTTTTSTTTSTTTTSTTTTTTGSPTTTTTLSGTTTTTTSTTTTTTSTTTTTTSTSTTTTTAAPPLYVPAIRANTSTKTLLLDNNQSQGALRMMTSSGVVAMVLDNPINRPFRIKTSVGIKGIYISGTY